MNAKIFVSAGTHTKGFERLIKKIDEIAGTKKFEFFAQTGNTAFEPKFEFKKFISSQEMNEKIEWCDLLIVHGGAGTIGPAMQKKKKIIIFPRLKEFNEHTDNHQLEMGKAIEKEYGFPCITEEKKIEETIIKTLKRNDFNFNKENKMEKILIEFIEKQNKLIQ